MADILYHRYLFKPKLQRICRNTTLSAPFAAVRIVVPAFEMDTILAFIIENEINNIFIIIEDSGKYFDNTVSDTQKIYLRDVKNKGRETLLVYHFFNDIPTRLFKLCDRLILKKTHEKYTVLVNFFKIISL